MNEVAIWAIEIGKPLPYNVFLAVTAVLQAPKRCVCM